MSRSAPSAPTFFRGDPFRDPTEEPSHDRTADLEWAAGQRDFHAGSQAVDRGSDHLSGPSHRAPQRGLSTIGALHAICGSSALLFLPLAALLINSSLAFSNPAWATARPALLWTAGLPLLGLVGSLVHFAVFVIPLGEDAYGPGVPLGWPPRLLLLTYMGWLVTLAWQALRLSRHAAQEATVSSSAT